MNYYTKKLKTISLKVKEPEATKEKTCSSKQCFDIAKEIYKTLDDDQEHFTVFFLNNRNEINGFKTIFSGGQYFASVDLKVIFRYSLQFGASAIIAVHNHPSGNTKPSFEDEQITEKIVKAGKLIGITLIDHLVISNNDYFSFADEWLIARYKKKIEK